MRKIPCETIQDLLPAYIDGKVSEETRGAVEEHLAACEECRKLCENMRLFLGEEGAGEAKESGKDVPVDFLGKTRRKRRLSLLVPASIAVVIAVAALVIPRNVAANRELSGAGNAVSGAEVPGGKVNGAIASAIAETLGELAEGAETLGELEVGAAVAQDASGWDDELGISSKEVALIEEDFGLTREELKKLPADEVMLIAELVAAKLEPIEEPDYDDLTYEKLYDRETNEPYLQELSPEKKDFRRKQRDEKMVYGALQLLIIDGQKEFLKTGSTDSIVDILSKIYKVPAETLQTKPVDELLFLYWNCLYNRSQNSMDLVCAIREAIPDTEGRFAKIGDAWDRFLERGQKEGRYTTYILPKTNSFAESFQAKEEEYMKLAVAEALDIPVDQLRLEGIVEKAEEESVEVASSPDDLVVEMYLELQGMDEDGMVYREITSDRTMEDYYNYHNYYLMHWAGQPLDIVASDYVHWFEGTYWLRVKVDQDAQGKVRSATCTRLPSWTDGAYISDAEGKGYTYTYNT